jgi:hypothetical protein
MVRQKFRIRRKIDVTKMVPASRSHIGRVVKIIQDTEKSGLLNSRRPKGLSGISGLKTVGLLQRLAHLFAEENNVCYLENWSVPRTYPSVNSA